MLSEQRYSSAKLRKFRDICMEGCNFVPPTTGGPDVVCVNISIFTWTKWDELSQLPWTKIVQKSKYNKTKLQYRPWALQYLHVWKLCVIWWISTKIHAKTCVYVLTQAFTHRLFTHKFECIFMVTDFSYKNTCKLHVFLYNSKCCGCKIRNRHCGQRSFRGDYTLSLMIMLWSRTSCFLINDFLGCWLNCYFTCKLGCMLLAMTVF